MSDRELLLGFLFVCTIGGAMGSVLVQHVGGDPLWVLVGFVFGFLLTANAALEA